MDRQKFFDGQLFDIYKEMGAHPGKEGVRFVTFAPRAKRIAVIGEFNGWQEEALFQDGRSGFFYGTIAAARPGQMYKYRVYTENGGCVEHCDPYGFGMELRPAFCSIIRDLSEYTFQDEEWMRNRTDGKEEAVNIYELHLGSWKKKSDAETGWYRYDELADLLIPYLKENHYTHVEMMPLSEHPFDGSWGYQNTGFFAPTARYGTAAQLMELIDRLHQAGIGAIMDFVPVHFAVDAYGLKEYDGTSLYEYPHKDVGESEWGSCNFIHSRREVQCFLQSAANYWLTEYHFDGLRMDAVSRLLYWQGEEKRGVNHVTVDFLKRMNEGLKSLHPTAMLIAEDSTSFPNVTKPVWAGGLGFDYKWDLGWMHDTLEYFQTGPEYRSRDYHKLTFSMVYFWNENYLLELSHDENVHGKATIMQKMHGTYEDKFPQAKAMYLYMMMHPGKKLLFMGSELGQFREWDESREQDWDILKYPVHDAFHRYMVELNRLYQEQDALHRDYRQGNFEWADCHQEERCIYAIRRKGTDRDLIAVWNLSDRLQEDYRLDLGECGTCELLLHTEWENYGGTRKQGEENCRIQRKQEKKELQVSLPRYSGMLLSVMHPGGETEEPEEECGAGKFPEVTLEMESGGRIRLRLRPDKAPNAVNSILELAELGGYDGLVIQRIAPDFVLQPWYDEQRMDERFQYIMEGEFDANGYPNDLPFHKYTVGMAGDGAHISSCGCIFIVAGEHCEERLNGKYTAVGEVVEGFAEVDRIMQVETKEIDSGMEGVVVREPVKPEIIRRAVCCRHGYAAKKTEKILP